MNNYFIKSTQSYKKFHEFALRSFVNFDPVFLCTGCDMVGFHIEDYCVNFLDCCQRILGCRVDRKKMIVEHHRRSGIFIL
jgi:hypothetical protein